MESFVAQDVNAETKRQAWKTSDEWIRQLKEKCKKTGIHQVGDKGKRGMQDQTAMELAVLRRDGDGQKVWERNGSETNNTTEDAAWASAIISRTAHLEVLLIGTKLTFASVSSNKFYFECQHRRRPSVDQNIARPLLEQVFHKKYLRGPPEASQMKVHAVSGTKPDIEIFRN